MKTLKKLENEREGLLFDLRLKRVCDGRKTAFYNPNIKTLDAQIQTIGDILKLINGMECRDKKPPLNKLEFCHECIEELKQKITGKCSLIDKGENGNRI